MANLDLYRLDGHTLRVFLTVLETGSLSRTAAIFDLNQSTISHTVDRMRSAIGDPLFLRNGRGITPTEKALAIAPRIQEIIASIEGLTIGEAYDPALDQTPIIVGVPTPALMPQMKAVYYAIRAVAPNLLFQARRLAPRGRIGEMLSLGEADVAISVNAEKIPPTLNRSHYGRDDLVVYYDPACRGPVESLADYVAAKHGVAGFGGKSKSVVEAALEEHGLEREISFVAPTASTLGDFMVGTDIIATMPRGLADNAYSALTHCPAPLPLPEICYDIVWHRRYDHSGRNQWIRNLLLDNAPGLRR